MVRSDVALRHLLAEDDVRVAQDVEFFLGDFAEAPHREPRPREGLAPHYALGQTELAPERAHLVLEQTAEGLHYADEPALLGETAHVVMALYVGAADRAALDDVGIDGALREEAPFISCALLLEHSHELLADDLALLFGLRDAREPSEETLFRVHAHKAERPAAERCSYLLPLVLAHHAVIHEYAGETVGHRALDERRRHGGIHPSREPKHHLVSAHGLADPLNLALDVGVHGVIALGAAHLVEEVADDAFAAAGALHFGVELHAVQPSFVARDRRRGTIRRHRRHAEAFRHPRYVVGVAHQRAHGAPDSVEEHAFPRRGHFRRTVFGHFAGVHLASQRRAHHLHTVAYPEHGYAQPEQRGIRFGRVLRVHAERTACEDDAYGRERAHFLRGRRARKNDGMHPEPAHAPRDELLILPAEIKHQYCLMFPFSHSL